MVRVGLWLLAAVFLASGLLLIFFLLRDRLGASAATAWTATETVQFAGILLAVGAVLLAVSALQVAITGYRENKEAIGKQSAELNAAKANLETLGTKLQNRQELVNNTAPAPKTLPAPEQAAGAAESKEGKPVVELLYDTAVLAADAGAVDLQRGKESRMPFTVRNSGNAAAEKGTLVVIADPPTVHVDQAGHPVPDRRNPHRYQVALPDLPPSSQESGDFLLELELRNVPAEFTLSFSIFGENFEAVRRRIPFRLVP
jgi:hypothetical protein